MESRCLFCKRDSSTSVSREHVIPESLGSKIKVLPKGIVCDKCNNYFARKVEHPLMAHPSFRNIRAYFQIPTKGGKMPSLLGVIGGSEIGVNFKLGDDQKIKVEAEYGRHQAQLKEFWKNAEQTGDFSPLLFPVDMNPPQREMSRFLAKMGIEFLAYRFLDSPEMIAFLTDHPAYDPIRQYARIGNNVKEWPFHQRHLCPMDTEMIHPETGEWVNIGFSADLMLTPQKETYFIFMLYGEEFAINLVGPSIDGYKLWLESNNNISPVIERIGLNITYHNIDGKNFCRLEGDDNVAYGVIFDRQKLNSF